MRGRSRSDKRRSDDRFGRFGWRTLSCVALVLVTAGVLVRIASNNADPSPTVAAPPPAPVALHPSPHDRTSSKAPLPKVAVEQRKSTVCKANKAPQLVLVSLGRQHAWMCERHRQVKTSAVTTGDVQSGNATPTGSWTVQAKQRDRWLSGPGYRQFVRYWIPFNGDYGFHDAPWQTMPFGSPGYVKHGSHGCVHLPMTVASWLYHWVVPGKTEVRIIAA